MALLALFLALLAPALSATTVIPVSDGELFARADLVVHGVVLSNQVGEDVWGRPETVTLLRSVEVIKGSLSGDLVLHQAGGTLPDGRFFQLFGRPEYPEGREIVVFAIARPEGEFQTAEMFLGKFEVWSDTKGSRFAVPDLLAGVPEGVTVKSRLRPGSGEPDLELEALSRSPRELESFLRYLRGGARGAMRASGRPQGRLAPVEHGAEGSARKLWGNISNSLWRWNPPTAVWTLQGTANMTGGGIAEANGALASWTNEPNSSIVFSSGPGSPSQIYLNAMSSPCGWSTCITGSGVIGCGGPRGGGIHTWRGEDYFTVTYGEAWLRSYCNFDAFTSTITESVLLHEVGHAIGLGHSNANFSSHDVCPGDESVATMYSTVQNRRTLGTDDSDAVRWLYGDGGTFCAPPPPSIQVTSVSPSFGPTSGGALLTIGGVSFQPGATVMLGAVPATGVTFVNSTTLTATAPAGVGTVGVIVTNPDTQNGTLSNSFTYSSGAGFYTLAPCRIFDTRLPDGPFGGPALAGLSERTFAVAGQCGIPATARAISGNLTVTQSTNSGSLRLYSGGDVLTLSSAINYRALQTRANNAIALLGPAGLGVRSDQPAGTVHVIFDVNGYFE